MLALATLPCFIYLQGGDVLQETIISNVTEDVVTLEFQRSDGTLVTQLIDFRKVDSYLCINKLR